MWKWLHPYAKADRAYQLCNTLLPYFAVVTVVCMIVGWVWGLAYAPADYQQKDSYRIIFIHVPALIWGIYMELTHSICPLTYLENFLLQKANLSEYSEGFIQHYLVSIVYPNNLTEDLQTHLAIGLIVANMILYGSLSQFLGSFYYFLLIKLIAWIGSAFYLQ